MVKNKINLSLNEPYVRQVYAKEGDSGRLYKLDIDPTPTSNGTMRIKRPDGVEVASPASLGEDITESGEVVSFSALDEAPMSSLKVGIEPIQDLHGQSNPYPAGGGKNLLTTSLADLTTRNTSGTWSNNVYTISNVAFTINSDGTITINGTSSAGIFFNFYQYLDGKRLSLTAGSYVLHKTGNADVTISVAKDNSYWGQANTTDTVLTADADFNFTSYIYIASGKTITNFVLKPMFEKGSTPTSWSPYSNICPIYANVGKNLHIPYTYSGTAGGNAAITYSSDGSATLNGTANASAGIPTISVATQNGFNYVLPKGTYTISISGNTTNVSFEAYNTATIAGVANNSSPTFTLTEETSILFRVAVQSGKTYNNQKVYMQLELGSSATSYVPYNTQTVYLSPTESVADATTYQTTLPQLVYGGTLDVVSGKLTVEWARTTFGDLDWTGSSPTSNIYRSSSLMGIMKAPPTGSDAPYSLCSAFGGMGYNPISASDNGKYAVVSANNLNAGRLIVIDHNYSDLTQFTNGNADVQLVYPLITPTEVNLTPQQINTLVGENNLWASCGDVLEVKFAYDGMLSALPSQATEVVGRCIGDVELGGVSTMPFTLVVQKNNQGE